jgi:hypothetical protein
MTKPLAIILPLDRLKFTYAYYRNDGVRDMLDKGTLIMPIKRKVKSWKSTK